MDDLTPITTIHSSPPEGANAIGTGKKHSSQEDGHRGGVTSRNSLDSEQSTEENESPTGSDPRSSDTKHSLGKSSGTLTKTHAVRSYIRVGQKETAPVPFEAQCRASFMDRYMSQRDPFIFDTNENNWLMDQSIPSGDRNRRGLTLIENRGERGIRLPTEFTPQQMQGNFYLLPYLRNVVLRGELSSVNQLAIRLMNLWQSEEGREFLRNLLEGRGTISLSLITEKMKAPEDELRRTISYVVIQEIKESEGEDRPFDEEGFPLEWISLDSFSKWIQVRQDISSGKGSLRLAQEGSMEERLADAIRLLGSRPLGRELLTELSTGEGKPVVISDRSFQSVMSTEADVLYITVKPGLSDFATLEKGTNKIKRCPYHIAIILAHECLHAARQRKSELDPEFHFGAYSPIHAAQYMPGVGYQATIHYTPLWGFTNYEEQCTILGTPGHSEICSENRIRYEQFQHLRVFHTTSARENSIYHLGTRVLSPITHELAYRGDIAIACLRGDVALLPEIIARSTEREILESLASITEVTKKASMNNAYLTNDVIKGYVQVLLFLIRTRRLSEQATEWAIQTFIAGYQDSYNSDELAVHLLHFVKILLVYGSLPRNFTTTSRAFIELFQSVPFVAQDEGFQRHLTQRLAIGMPHVLPSAQRSGSTPRPSSRWGESFSRGVEVITSPFRWLGSRIQKVWSRSSTSSSSPESSEVSLTQEGPQRRVVQTSPANIREVGQQDLPRSTLRPMPTRDTVHMQIPPVNIRGVGQQELPEATPRPVPTRDATRIQMPSVDTRENGQQDLPRSRPRPVSMRDAVHTQIPPVNIRGVGQQEVHQSTPRPVSMRDATHIQMPSVDTQEDTQKELPASTSRPDRRKDAWPGAEYV